LMVRRERRNARLAIGQTDGSIVGAHVSIHRDAVEGLLDAVQKKALQLSLLDGGIRRNKTEHRRHIRVDHPRAFGGPSDPDGLSAHWKLDRYLFVKSVTRHDGPSEGRTRLAVEPREQLRDCHLDLLDR